MNLLTGLLVDGEADSFARMLHPGLKPWLIDALTPAQKTE
jgi:hypothetical protein